MSQSKDTEKTPEKTSAPDINELMLYLSDFGKYICLVFFGLARKTGKGLAALFRLFIDKTSHIYKGLFDRIKYLGVLLLSPFLKVIHSFQRAHEDISGHREKMGLGAALRSALSHIKDFLFGKSGVAVTAFNLAAPLICLAFLVNIVSYASSLKMNVRLVVNDKFLGYIENEQVFYDADEILKERINYLGSDENISLEPSFSIELSGNNVPLTKYQVADKILEYSDINVQYAYGFYMNGVFQGAIPDSAPVIVTLDAILDRYRERYPDAEIEFKDKLEYSTSGLYLSGSIIDTDWLISQLTSVKSKAGYYIAEDGDTPEGISEKLKLSMSQLEFMNPGFSDMTLYAGDKIKIRDEIPFLSVNVTVIEEKDIEIPFETEYYNDDSLYSGVTRVTKDGVPGKNHITSKVTYVNNIETKRTVLSSSVVSSPVTKRIAMGTKPTPEQKYSPADAGYGKFIWPTEGGKISQYTQWDGGYAGHTGIDITSSGYGAPIFAGASGTVTFAGTDYSGYGNYIIIDHGNGLQTLYGHCSALYVTVGQKVTQGEFIAAMGATGLADGVHLHFEVRQGNIRLNPVHYLEGYS